MAYEVKVCPRCRGQVEPESDYDGTILWDCRAHSYVEPLSLPVVLQEEHARVIKESRQDYESTSEDADASL